MPRRRPGANLHAALAAAALAWALLPVSAHAQVTINPGALDLLPAPRPDSRTAEPRSSEPRTSEPRAPARPRRPPQPPAQQAPAQTPAAQSAQPPASRPPATPAPATPALAKPPPVPVIPPAIAALPPPAPVPPPRAQPAPAVPVAPDAPGTATATPAGLRITFGADRQDLNPATEAALRALAQTLLHDPAATVNLYAYAAGAPEDPSTPRRLSLARALAARAVLIREGVASPRIYPRALGPDTDPAAPPDRVDAVPGPPAPPRPQAAAQVPAQAPAR